MDLQLLDELWVLLRGEQLQQVDEIVPIDLLKHLQIEHVSPTLQIMPQGLQHIRDPDVRLPCRQPINGVHVLKHIIQPNCVVAGDFFELLELEGELPKMSD